MQVLVGTKMIFKRKNSVIKSSSGKLRNVKTKFTYLYLQRPEMDGGSGSKSQRLPRLVL